MTLTGEILEQNGFEVLHENCWIHKETGLHLRKFGTIFHPVDDNCYPIMECEEIQYVDELESLLLKLAKT